MPSPIPASHEQSLWSGTVSHLHYFGKWLWVIILLAALAGSFLISFPEPREILWAIRGGLLLLALFVIFWIYLDRSRRRYAVTNKRVSVEYGIIGKRSNEVRLQDIRSINLRKTGLSGLLGVGTVEFSSAATDDADVIFWNTAEAEKVRDLVRSLQS
jgi:membrane protein YdbS with pleckstrin-like domain